jgi:hypothetical protein
MMNMKVKLFALAIAFLALTAMSCTKEHRCYDKKLEREYRDVACLLDCPGVIGCDGKFYCNACEAARHGIKVK